MEIDVNKIGQTAGHWAVVTADDLPSPQQLDLLEQDDWRVFQIIPMPSGSKQVTPGSIAIYLRHISA